MFLRLSLVAGALLILAAPAGAQAPTLAPVTIRDQNDGVNSQRMTTVAAFCRGPAACAGKAKLVRGGQTLDHESKGYILAG